MVECVGEMEDCVDVRELVLALELALVGGLAAELVAEFAATGYW